jgi:20S proteasome alpha/beta subunit
MIPYNEAVDNSKLLTRNKQSPILVTDTELERGLKRVTVGIAMTCKDGIVIGADRKVTRYRGTHVKSLETKIVSSQFKDGRIVLCCYAGNYDFANRILVEINPEIIESPLGCDDWRDIIETNVCKLSDKITGKGLEFDTTILFATIDADSTPTVGHVTTTGGTELGTERYFTTGIAAPYAEFVLNDVYDANMSIYEARLMIASLIHKIGEVDNDVEGLDVYAIKSDSPKKIIELTKAERYAIDDTPLSLHFMEDLDTLKKEIKTWRDIVEPKGEKYGTKKGKSKSIPEAENKKKE